MLDFLAQSLREQKLFRCQLHTWKGVITFTQLSENWCVCCSCRNSTKQHLDEFARFKLLHRNWLQKCCLLRRTWVLDFIWWDISGQILDWIVNCLAVCLDLIPVRPLHLVWIWLHEVAFCPQQHRVQLSFPRMLKSQLSLWLRNLLMLGAVPLLLL